MTQGGKMTNLVDDMRLSVLLLYSFATLVLLLTSFPVQSGDQAADHNQNDHSDRGTLIIYKIKHGFVSGALPPRLIVLDTQVLGQLKKKAYFEMAVDPGQHDIWAVGTNTCKYEEPVNERNLCSPEVLTIDVTPGGQYFVEIAGKPMRRELIARSSTDGSKATRKLNRRETRPSETYSGSFQGYNELHRAVVASDVEKLTEIIAAGADVDARAINTSPIVLAAESGQTEIVKILLSNEANTNPFNKGPNPLTAAIGRGHRDVVEQLLLAGAVYGSREYGGETALMLAAKNGHTSTAMLLLNSGLRVDAVRDDGQQAIHLASLGGHSDTIDSLLSMNADINSPSASHGRPINRAAEREHVGVVNHLLEKGAIPISVESTGETAFGSGFAWRLYSDYHEENLTDNQWRIHSGEADRLLGIARNDFVERREHFVALLKKEKRSDFWFDVIAGAIAGTVVGLEQQRIESNQRQVAQIAALEGAQSYGDYSDRMESYEQIMLYPDTYESHHLDISSTPYLTPKSQANLAVTISELDRRIALANFLLQEN